MSPSDDRKVKIFPDVTDAHDYLKTLPLGSGDVTDQFRVLVTGSLHLVGAFLQLLDPDLRESLKVS